MNTLCFECGNPATVRHHVVPESKGGTKTVPLCAGCHSIVHDAKLVTLSTLIKEGRKKSQERRAEIIERCKKGEVKSQVAEICGVSRNTVYNICEAEGIHVNIGKGLEEKVDSELTDLIKTMRDNGESWQNIQNKLNLSHTHLYRIIKEHGWIDGKYGGGSKNRDTYITLDDAKIEQAKKLRQENKTWEEIATTIGVDRTTLYKHGLPQQFKPLRGQMTKDKKQEARKLRAEGRTWKEIAQILEVSIGSIYVHKLHKE